MYNYKFLLLKELITVVVLFLGVFIFFIFYALYINPLPIYYELVCVYLEQNLALICRTMLLVTTLKRVTCQRCQRSAQLAFAPHSLNDLGGN